MTLASFSRLFAFALLVAAMGCDTSDGPSLFDPDRPVGADPVVSSISPTGVVLAGIDEITISGSNFSETPGDNVVFFGDVIAEVLSASSTELRVRAPNTPGENIPVRVSVRGASQFSSVARYSLTPAVVDFGGLTQSETPFGITTDGDGTLYLAVDSDGSKQIITIAPDGARGATPFFSTAFDFSTLAVGTDGSLYAVRGVFAAFRLPEGGTQEVFGVVSDGRPSLTALATGPGGNLYVGGNNGDGTRSIYRIASDKSVTTYPLEGNVRALEVYNGAVYAAVTTAGTSQIIRLAADASGDLGEASVYADASALGGSEATALAFAASGDLYVGTAERTDPLYLVRSDGSGEVLYPGVLSGPAARLAYGPGTSLYMRTATVRNAENSVIQPATLVRIETRQVGASG